ncbi:leucine-rich repeat extensin-like protein 5 [Helianthus annuus]|uniref:leucine-rich repeat extensin-like protein 5 n=1 Tax=Helianthus annuus TaxID=4232 RepID=UPI000B906A7E|nr:leucine-rich repeat extensin-like protein 5 [Helianthus annuus]
MDMDEDTDPVEPPTGMPTHPIEILDGSSFHGSPYHGPDSYQARFAQYDWVFTPSYHSSPHQQQDPSEDSRFVAVTPPPPPQFTAYNPFKQPAHTNYNYAEVDPYQVAWDYNALHPEGPYGAPWGVGYPAYGYQQPPPPQPPHQQPPQPQLIPPERQ